nr:RNA-directed DNA polymerase, eukaryota [Tanacetum cinerariifolium]
MPFGLCNASATFQRCMTAIFHDMVKDFMKVFMEDLSVFEEMHSDSMGSKTIHNGGSLLGVMEDFIRIGQAMGYAMEGSVNDLATIIGNSGGILCIWEVLIFKKDYVTISDNFIAIYGTWLPCNSKILFIVVYAPQQATYKRCLWDYISTIIGCWNGESIVMGDFNEVRTSDERRGSSFNPYGAKYFDRFIVNSGLIDVTLEGFSFTWSHPSALKMSKLDRFLVSEGIFSMFPSIAALCLDRHLSDHRPILLRENNLLKLTEIEAKDMIQKSKV